MQILISIGSNVNADSNVATAIALLSQLISNAKVSETISTKPFGKQYKNDFCNCLMSGNTLLSLPELEERLKTIEKSLGRTADSKLSGLVPIDIDVLQYGVDKYHLRDWQRPYVTKLLPSLSE